MLLLRLEVAGEPIRLHVNDNKTENMMYNQVDRDTVTLNTEKTYGIQRF